MNETSLLDAHVSDEMIMFSLFTPLQGNVARLMYGKVTRDQAEKLTEQFKVQLMGVKAFIDISIEGGHGVSIPRVVAEKCWVHTEVLSDAA